MPDGPRSPFHISQIGSTDEREGIGLALLQKIAAIFRSEFGDIPRLEPPPLGPQFDYSRSRELFGTRPGAGPLHIAWDTNLLVDYFDFGRALWEFDRLPAEAHDRDELEALQFVMAVWVIRDVRFHILPRFLEDARKGLSEARRRRRAVALDAFEAALSHMGYDPTEPVPTTGLLLPDSAREYEVRKIGDPLDRLLVRQALHMGVHVFMTRDKRLISWGAALRPFGLWIASPGDLLEEFVACGALHCLIHPRGHAYWPIPDLTRVLFLLEALPPEQRPDIPVWE